jgi:glutathione S-transferase
MFLDPNFKTHFTFLEQQLASSLNNGNYLCGNNLTGADILMSFLLIAGKGRARLTKEARKKALYR